MTQGQTLGFLLFLGALILFAYLLPTIVAFGRDHPQKLGIFLVNLITGWSVIGYVLSLIWAFRNPETPITIIQQHAPPESTPPPIPPRPTLEQELEILESLRNRKLVTEEEYSSRRARIIDSIG